MLHIAICDDCDEFLLYLTDQTRKIITSTEECRLYKTNNPKNLLNYLHCNIIDILLLDINLPDVNGFDIARMLQYSDKKPIIIFITEKDQLVFDSFKYSPFRFIRKSHITDELSEALNSAKDILHQSSSFCCFKDINTGMNYSIIFDKIVYFESVKNYISVYALEEDYCFRGTLKKLEAQCPNYFYRIYNSYLLNVNYIYLLQKDTVDVRWLDKKILLPICRGKKKEINQLFLKIARDQ